MAANSTMLLIGLLTGMVIGLAGVTGFLLGRRAGRGGAKATGTRPSGESAAGMHGEDGSQGESLPYVAQDAARQSAAQDGARGSAAQDGAGACGAGEVAATHGAQDATFGTITPNLDPTEPIDLRAINNSQLTAAETDDVDSPAAPSQEPAGSELAAMAPQAAEPLDMAEFARELSGSEDPYARLRRFVRDINKRQADAENNNATAPDAISTYLARGLEEAGLLNPEAKALDFRVVLPSRSRTIYLGTDASKTDAQDMARVIALEGALNRALFAWEGLVVNYAENAEAEAEATEASEVSLENCYAFNQGLSTSICAQLGRSPIPRASMLDIVGEWGARQTFSAGLESLRLPLRLTAHYRMNLMGGDIAIEMPFVPASCQPRSVYSPELGRIVATSHQMREQMACDYALRCAILLAAHAFRSSRRLCHAYVAVMGPGKARACLISGDISREGLRQHDLSRPFDARELARELNMRFNLENDRLAGVEQGFALENERFCPASRYEVIDLSRRVLPRFEAELLGAQHVSDLAINEDAHRCAVAEDVASGLGTSVETNVRRILNITQADADKTVREAGRRCAAAMISGELAEDDPLAFTEQFVSGDDLSRACNEAIELLRSGKDEIAIAKLTDVLAPIDSLDTYRDENGVVWRCFSSYVGRTLYNRLKAREGEQVRLVPDSYYSAQLLMSTALLRRGRANEAYGFARRAQDLNPFDSSGLVRVVRALEINGDLEQAAAQVRQGLELVYDPEAVGALYYRLAFLSWRLGNAELADACYQKTLATGTSWAVPAQVELFMLRAKTADEGVAPEDVENVIAENGVPLAPTERILEVLVEAAQGATDAEVFPVAKSFATLLGALSHDDVMYGVAASIEREPDR